MMRGSNSVSLKSRIEEFFALLINTQKMVVAGFYKFPQYADEDSQSVDSLFYSHNDLMIS
jgi:hypothetical protein